MYLNQIKQIKTYDELLFIEESNKIIKITCDYLTEYKAGHSFFTYKLKDTPYRLTELLLWTNDDLVEHFIQKRLLFVTKLWDILYES